AFRRVPKLSTGHALAPVRARRARDVGLVGLGYVRGLKTLRSLRDRERHALSLLERPEAGAADCRVMHENVLTFVGGDESVALLTVEPLDLALCHGSILLPLLMLQSPGTIPD